jgi:hypothetical protein
LRKLPLAVCLLSVCLGGLSCGGSSSSGTTKTSGILYRVFVTNSVSAATAAGVYIVNGQNDVHPPTLSPIGAGNTPGMMVLTPNLATTLVFSGENTASSDNQLTVIANTAESATGHTTLPGYTESIVVSPDSSTAYTALPTATVVGQSPGVIDVVSTPSAAITGQVAIPSVHFLAINNDGSRLLAMTDVLSTLGPACSNQTPAFLFIVTPSSINIDPCPVVPVPGFDHPVQAFFSSDNTTAYVVNCGAECGGTQASIQQLNMTTGALGSYGAVCVPDANGHTQCASTVGLMNGSTLYLAGTPYSGGNPSLTCTGAQGETLNCGMLTIFNLNTMMPVNSTAIAITDGYHNRIAMAPYGQLFIGARTCTEIIPPVTPPPPGTEVRGCLSIYNTLNTPDGTNPAGGVLIPPQNGDVTGLQPLSIRSVVYVVQGGSIYIYDATYDALQPAETQFQTYAPEMVGYFIDVKTVDF